MIAGTFIFLHNFSKLYPHGMNHTFNTFIPLLCSIKMHAHYKVHEKIFMGKIYPTWYSAEIYIR
jgi:hypothetical protein